ncbi:Protein EFR3 [Termitomyces sp. J132]|nr:Protein EFR3 [Termitomyces sp. J132]
MHHLFTPNHVQLLNSCYPPASALLTAGPEYSPNSQELSRLSYYASNHPSKLTKICSEIEKRVRHEARKARAGNIRTRASLLISLSILRALATECRRDIALLSPSLVACVDVTMEAVPTDLEVAARAASVFTSWTTYTDGHLIGTDSTLTKDYLSALSRFAALSRSTLADNEIRNRTRLIGFAALFGALSSGALYHDPIQFKTQVSTLMRPILVTLFETGIDNLDQQAIAIKDMPSSPYLAEFRARPAVERRAPSIHLHIDGDQGPSMGDVSNAALSALCSLAGHTNGVQLGIIMDSAFDSINDAQAWNDVPHCCWLSQKMAEWAQYQYRFAVPTWLVERLCKNPDVPSAVGYHATVAEMATTIFSSSVPLVNLSTSDITSSLIALLLRRVESDPDDAILPELIGCLSSLGRHVYYSDQIQDLTSEIIHHITVLEARGVISQGRSGSTISRTQAIRCLLAALFGLIQAADMGKSVEKSDVIDFSHGSTPAEAFKQEVANGRISRRTPIPPDVWQDTVSLLCDNDYAIRSDYADALMFYLAEEMPKHGDNNGESVKRLNGMTTGPLTHAVKPNILLHAGNHGTKFLHAVHAYLYILATSSSLGLASRIPMLIALHSVTANVKHSGHAVNQRVNAINEVIARVWLILGLVWNAPQLAQLAETALASAPNILPAIQRSNLTNQIYPRDPVEFPSAVDSTVEWKGVSVSAALDILTNSSSVLEATGLDREGLLHRLSSLWTPDEALKNSVERSSSFDNTLRDGLAPLLKISPALMHIENISQQSLARSTRGVGVADLRGALEGRNSISNPALVRPASISTLDHAPSTMEGGSKLTQTRSRTRNQKRPSTRGAGEVRDVLNKLGIGGKQNENLLKASFPTLPKSNSRAPPYKS